IGIKEISIIFLLILPVTLAYERTEDIFFVYEKYSYPAKLMAMSFNDSFQIGISTDTWILDFGQIYVGMGSRKYINVSASDDVKVSLKATGNISSVMKFEKNNFLLLKGKSENIPIYVEPKSVGNYSGEVRLTFKRIKYPFFKWLLKCV
ncbi:MAG: hypothetical protein QXO84_03205, partial [Candidatus Aenigmatarchaeota archaeon]